MIGKREREKEERRNEILWLLSIFISNLKFDFELSNIQSIIINKNLNKISKNQQILEWFFDALSFSSFKKNGVQ